MRKLVWFSLGFGAACCLCAYVLTGSVRVILAVAGGVLTLLTAIAGKVHLVPAGCRDFPWLCCGNGLVYPV